MIVAGLDQDYLGRPFDPMPQLLAIAEYVDKTLAICMVLRRAGQSQPAAGGGPTDRVVVGGAHNRYEARCRRCFDPTLSREEETNAVREASGKAR